MSAVTPVGGVVLGVEEIASKVLTILGSPGGLKFMADKVTEWEQAQAKLDTNVDAMKDAPQPGLKGGSS